MSSNRIDVEFRAKSASLEAGAKKTERAIMALQGQVSHLAGAFNRSQKEMAKMRGMFTNITNDANRTSGAFGKLGNTLKMGLGVGVLYSISSAFKRTVQSAMESTETLNLFEVAMGNATTATEEFVQEMNKAFKMDVTNVRSAVGTYALLAKSMGLSSENASKLSENTYKLAVDLASLTNVPINQTLADLRSGLVGQSETVYKYGIDVTEASLATEALAQGISKSVRNMSQGEKMALRYAVMLKQTRLAQGDFANTIENASNQLRVAQDQLVTLVRTIGTAFIPILTTVLPYINAFITSLINVAKAIATLFGFKEEDPIGIERPAIESGDLADNLDDAEKSAKKMKQHLSGMDELNVLNKDTGSASGTGVSAGDPNDMKIGEYDNMMASVKNTADELSKSIDAVFTNIATKAKPATDALKVLADLVFTGFIDLLSKNYDGLKSLGNIVFTGIVEISKLTFEGLAKLAPLVFKGIDDLAKVSISGLSTLSSMTFSGLEVLSPLVFDGLTSLAPLVFTGLEKIATVSFETLTSFLDVLSNGKDSISEIAETTFSGFIELADKSWGGINLLWDGFLSHLVGFTISEVLPQTLEFLHEAIKIMIEVINGGLGALTWFIEKLLPALNVTSEFGGNILVGVLEGMNAGLKTMSEWMTENSGLVVEFTKIIGAFFIAWKLTELMAFIQMSGGLITAINLITNAIKLATVAKLLNNIETVALTILYAGDFLRSIMATIVQVGIQTSAFVANKLAVMASTIKTALLTTALWLQNSALVATIAKIGVQTSAFVLNKLAVIASTIKTGLLTAGLWLYNGAMIAVNIVTGVFTGLLTILTSPITLVVAGITLLVAGAILLYKNWDKVTASMKEMWNKFKDFIKGMPDVVLALAGPLAPILLLIRHWDKLKVGMINVVNAIIKGINWMTDGVTRGINAVISMLNNFSFTLPDWMGGGTFGFNITPVVNNLKLQELAIAFVADAEETEKARVANEEQKKKIGKFAGGGFPQQGQMFIAREAGAEMVGSIGGKTAVANNDQIVQAVAQGVADAVSRVMQGGGQVIENVLMLDGDVIFKNQQQVARRRGNDFGMGVFAR